MMEFTLSRAAMMICGTLMLAAVIVPVSGIFDNDSEDLLEEMAHKDASALDSLLVSGMDEYIIHADALIPSPSYTVTLDGYSLTITDGDGDSVTAYMEQLWERVELGYSDTVIFRFVDGSFRIQE